MAKKASPVQLSSSDLNEEVLSSEEQQTTSFKRTPKRTSITNYVTGVLTSIGRSSGQPIDLTQTRVEIGTNPSTRRDYENLSAFQPYQFSTDVPSRTDAQRREKQSSTSDDEFRDQRPIDQVRKYFPFCVHYS